MVQGNAAVHSPGEAPPANPHHWWTLASVECGNFAVCMDGFIVKLALPPAGPLADIWGRRRIVVIGMGVLVVTSILAGLILGLRILKVRPRRKDRTAMDWTGALGLVGAVLSVARAAEAPAVARVRERPDGSRH